MAEFGLDSAANLEALERRVAWRLPFRGPASP